MEEQERRRLELEFKLLRELGQAENEALIRLINALNNAPDKENKKNALLETSKPKHAINLKTSIMKKIFTFIAVFLLLLASEQVFSVTNTWDGSSSNLWTVAANWSSGHVPLSTEDVVIPSAPANQPVINGVSTPVCANLTVNSGALLTISATSAANAQLTVGGTATFNGGFSIGGFVAKTGKIVATNVVWNSTATLSAFLGARCEVSGNWTFSSGSSIDMGYCWVTFTGTGNSTITNNSASSRFSSLTLGKTATATTYIGATSAATLTITGTLTINASNILNGAANITTILQSNLVSNGVFNFDYGTVSLERVSGTQEIQLATTGNYFNSLKINCGATVTLNNSLAIQGNLTIQSGTFNPQNNTLYVTGNWINTAGPAYFTEGTGKVVFNVIINKDGGKAVDQVIQNSENFNIFELNNAYGDLIINSGLVVVTCNQYDWVAGGINVSQGVFTALDLADNGIFGRYTLSGTGTINLTNDDGWVDLNGTTLNISGGNFNVYGGTTDSYWPFSQNASLTMSGGILNFAETGIQVSVSTTTLTSNITGGTIKTAKNFNNGRSDFNPTGGTIEMYGPTDASLSCVGSAALYGLKINKTATKDGDNSAIVYPRIDRETGEVITDESRAQTVNLTSPVTLNGNFTLSGGTFNSNSHTIQAKRDWTNNVGPGSFNPGTGRVIFNGGNYHQICFNETFNILEVAKASGGAFRVTSGTVNCAQYDWTIGSIDVLGGTFTASDLYENGLYGGFYVNPGGTINLYQDIYQYVDLNGSLTFTNGGTINVYGGNGDSQWASGANASITMNGGTLDFKDWGITLTMLSPNTITENITGGTIRTTGGFFCSRTDFTPTGGTIELYGTQNTLISQSAGSIFNLNINKAVANSVSLSTNITLSGGLTVNSGTLNVNAKTLTTSSESAVNNNGVLHLNAGSTLLIPGSYYLNVNSGGLFKAIGTAGNPALISRNGASGYIYINIIMGGNISARNAWFHYLNPLTINPGANIDPDNPFDDCQFRYCATGMLKVDNQQTLLIRNTEFLTPATGNNVYKSANSGVLTFKDATGNYSGAAYENDPYNRIDWTFTQPGLWTGAVSTNWNTAGNWDDLLVPTSATNVTIPTGVVNMPVISSGTANCNNLTLNGTLTMGNAILQVAGNAAMNGIFAMNHAAGQFIVQGDVDWNSGSTANITASSVIHAYGHWNFNTGANAQLGNGSVLFKGSSSKYIRSYSANCSFWNLVSNKTGSNSIEFYNLSTQPLTVNGTLTTEINSKFVSSCSQDIIIRGNLVGNGVFQCTAGWVILRGASQVITPNSNDYFNTLEFNQTGTVTIGNTYTNILNIRGGVKISSGVFDAAGNIIKVGSSWNNIAGPAAFVEGTSQVIFNGTLGQTIYTNEDFYIMEVNKPSGEVVINGPTVTCNSYNWTAGLIKLANGGVFTANDLADNGVFGDYDLQSGAIVNLHQDIYQYVDINGTLYLEDGCAINIYGGNGWSQWATGANTNIYMTGGALDFKDQGININTMSPYTLTIDITGGAIRTSGGFFCNRPDFTPTGGTIELYGTIDAGISLTGGSLWGLNVNKEPADSRSNTVTLETNVTVNGPLTINAGALKVTNKVLTTSDYISVNTGGTLWMDVNSQLKIAPSKTLHVNSGGTLKAIGLSENQPVFNRNGASGYYFIMVYNGGTIEAKWANFYYVNPLRVYPGATINPDYPFDYCKFRYCNVGMLKIENAQDLFIRQVEFLGAATGYNVSKTANSGSLNFRDASGDYSGAAHEDDPNNRITWTVTQPGLWTGAVSTDWHTAGNWDDLIVPASSTNVTIPADAVRMPVISNGYADCDQLTLAGTLTIQDKELDVAGSADIGGNLTVNHYLGALNVQGNINWNSGSTATFSAGGIIRVYGNWNFNDGSLAQLAMGSVLLIGEEPTSITVNSENVSFNDLYIEKDDGALITFNPASTAPIKSKGFYVSMGAAFSSDCAQDIIVTGNFYSFGNLTLNDGSVVFNGSDHLIIPNTGSYCHNLVFNQTGTVTINQTNTDTLVIKGDFTINSGIFSPANSTLKLGGSWINNFGPDAFDEGTSRVTFNGAIPQFCSTDEFYILEIDKPLHYFYDQSESNIFCQIYDWTQGGMWIAGGSTFHAADLADDGIFGDFVLWWNSIELHQDALQSIDLHGSISVNSGEFRVYGGNDESAWGAHANANVSMGDGVLDFVDQGIKIQDAAPYSFTSTISGGTIRTQKSFIVQSPGFDPMGGTVELYGAQNSAILSTEGGAFYNVLINKPSDFSTRATVWSSIVKNNFVVAEGLAEVGFGQELECWNNLEIQDGGWLGVNSGTIGMKYLSSVNVNNNGVLTLFGYEGAMSRVKGIVPTEQYSLSINSGGTLEAAFTIFEDLPEQGVYIAPGATVNPAYSFTNCEFRNGMSGPTTLLSVESDQDILIENAVFPANTWGGQYNVRKEVDAGSVTFLNATGDFSGEAFENDPFNRVFWNNVPVDLEVNNLIIGTEVVICFNAQQTLTVEDFSVDSGGSVTFIAGNKISFLPETWVKPGGYMHAWITTTNEYCGNLDASMVSVIAGDAELMLLPELASQNFSIYPNPTTGNFTIMHKGDFLPGTVRVEIFSMHGERIFSTSYAGERSHYFTLSGLPQGLCFVKIMAGDYVESLKLVIAR